MIQYKCGHNHCSKDDIDMKAHKEAYVSWKYSYGFGGSQELCFDCWRAKQ